MLKYFQPTKLIFQRRQLSTAASVIHDWKSRLTSHVDESHDNLAGSQFNLLANTLNDPLTEYKHDIIPPDGTPLPPAWHLVYFPPRFTENELASDGYELNFKPPNPFVHRMWAGARLEWDRKNPLRIGQTATMKSKLADVQVNEGRRGESAFVWIDKDIHNEHGYSMRESRCLVYVQEPTDGGDRATPAKRIKGKTHCYVFRFSFATS
jgi:3-methylfumaryl-CoA hydratase